MDLLAAITLGIVGSLHCVGMCGPLVLAMPRRGAGRWHFLAERLLHIIGKSTSYAVMGVVVGMVGRGLLMQMQQELSIVLGTLMLIAIAVPMAFRDRLERLSPLAVFYRAVKDRFGRLLGKRGGWAAFGLGVLNGFLPCGLVYTALVAATVVADPWQSGLFMALFGLGTAPALIAVAFSGSVVSLKFRSGLSKALPLVTVVIAVLLILRGMDLGIPYVSPKVVQPASVHQPTMDCCKE